MDRRTYILSAHPGCIEANFVERSGAEINLLTRLDSQFFLLKDDSTAIKATVLEKFDKNIRNYVDSHSFKVSKVFFLLPSEDITFRTLVFPFQDIRKSTYSVGFQSKKKLSG